MTYHTMDVLSQGLRRAKAMSEMLTCYASASDDRINLSNEALSGYAHGLDDHLTEASEALEHLVTQEVERHDREREAAKAQPPDPSGHIAAINECLLRMRTLAHAAREQKLGGLILDDLDEVGKHWRGMRNGGVGLRELQARTAHLAETCDGGLTFKAELEALARDLRSTSVLRFGA
ncbi:MAG TPA: hypothetical protein VM616_06310 [Gammaproteobacteria bacterium]|nr:hypothetical protein [Gammaproteobacteria bacterium]